MRHPYSAGYWEQSYMVFLEDSGFLPMSHHATYTRARAAATTLARRLRRPAGPSTGGALSWAAGVLDHSTGHVEWYDAHGDLIAVHDGDGYRHI